MNVLLHEARMCRLHRFGLRILIRSSYNLSTWVNSCVVSMDSLTRAKPVVMTDLEVPFQKERGSTKEGSKESEEEKT